MNDPMSVVRIDIYDKDGMKISTEKIVPNFEMLKDYMDKILYSKRIPILRLERPLVNAGEGKPCEDMQKVQFRKYEPFNWANDYIGKPVLMKMELKVDQQTLACEGFGHEVLKAQENFLRAIMPEFEGE